MPFYNAQEESNFNTYGYTAVSVIASFNTKGDFIPLYMQTEEKDERITLKVDSVYRIVEKKAFIEYDCYVTINEKRTLITLYYFIRNRIWNIKK